MTPSQTSAIRHSRIVSYVYIALSSLVALGMTAVALLPTNARRVLHTRGRLHSWWHLSAFIVVGYLAGKISKTPYQRVLLFGTCLAFGFATEFFEHFFYGGALETHDVWVDAIGVLFGAGIALLSV